MTLHDFDAKHDGDVPTWAANMKAAYVELKGTLDTLRQKAFDDDDKHESGHTRLRSDYRSLEGRVTAIESGRVADSAHFSSMDDALKNASKRTTDVSALRFTPSMVFATIAVCASIIGGAYASTWSLRADQAAMRSDIRDLATMMVSQASLEQERNKNTMLQVVQLKDTVAALSMQVTSLEGQLREVSATIKQRGK